MFERVAERLTQIAAEHCAAAEPAHDMLHVQRVVANARQISLAEGANLDIVLPAALLHELHNYPKDHPQSHLSGDVCAEKAAAVLQGVGYPPDLIEPVCYGIRYHSFSRGVVPETLEGQVLQDADRLDAIGAIGIARCFATGSDMRRPFYAPVDPFCTAREPDDKAWTLDHFYRKLLKIPATLHTETARRLAAERARFLETFLAQLAQELSGR